MITQVNEIQAKTILTKTNLPGSDWVINPYNGCQFACLYCYAAQIARFTHPQEEWGTYLDVKINAPNILAQTLNKLHQKLNRKDFGIIFFSSVTDPYTSLEAKYQLTRQCLAVLADFDYQGTVCIQTKSPLILKDIDILKKLKSVSIGFTITSLDDQVSRFLEVYAPPVSQRLKALEELHRQNLKTYAFIGPILPHFVKNKPAINQLLDQLQQVGVSEVWFEHLNQTSAIKLRLLEFLTTNAPNLISDFKQADTAKYRHNLNNLIFQCLEGRQLKLGLNQVIFHRDLPPKLKYSSPN